MNDLRFTQQIAYHEAGHVVAALAYRIKFQHVTIIPHPRKGYAGIVRMFQSAFRYTNRIDPARIKLDFLRNHMIFLLAGAMAEYKFLSKPFSLKEWLLQPDSVNLENLLAETGFNEKARLSFFEYIRLETEELFTSNGEDTSHWGLVDKLARQLLSVKTMTYEDIVSFFSEEPSATRNHDRYSFVEIEPWRK